MRTALRQVPSWQQIVPVYAVICLIVYSWTMLWFFWRLPGWLFFLNTGEILIALAYALVTNLLECVVVLCALVMLSLAVPRQWLHDVFVARGSALAMAGLGYMMLLAYQLRNRGDYGSWALRNWALALAMAAILFLVFLIGRLRTLRKAVELAAVQATIFAYLTAPLSLIAALVVLIHRLA